MCIGVTRITCACVRVTWGGVNVSRREVAKCHVRGVSVTYRGVKVSRMEMSKSHV